MAKQSKDVSLKQRLDFVQERLRLPDDKLAWYLGIHQKQLQAFRSGREDLPSHAGLILLDRTRYLQISAILLKVLPPAVREKIHAWEARHAAWIAEQNIVED